MSSKIVITVNSQKFTATLFDNNSTKVFKEMLPMAINMIELKENENITTCQSIFRPTHQIQNLSDFSLSTAPALFSENMLQI
ncbi:MAG: hypothetical protein IPG02_04835 [Ignavibacteria bacterium]|nr:hypothetical protein [Ignavibacteria bacterium]